MLTLTKLYNSLISATDWTFMGDQTDIDTLWNMWEERFTTIMEECIPKATPPSLHSAIYHG